MRYAATGVFAIRDPKLAEFLAPQGVEQQQRQNRAVAYPLLAR
jgi:hypothetical protein